MIGFNFREKPYKLEDGLKIRVEYILDESNQPSYITGGIGVVIRLSATTGPFVLCQYAQGNHPVRVPFFEMAHVLDQKKKKKKEEEEEVIREGSA